MLFATDLRIDCQQAGAFIKIVWHETFKPLRHEERDVGFFKKKKLLFNEKVNINYFWLSTKC